MASRDAEHDPLRILYFCVVSTNVDRFPGPLHRALQRLRPGVHARFVYVSETAAGDHERLSSKYPEVDLLRSGYSVRALVAAVAEFAPDVVVTIAKRLPDLLVTTVANQAGAETVVFQHGAESPYLPRSPRFFLGALRKTLFYSNCLWQLSTLNDVSFWRSLRDYRAYWFKGSKTFRESTIGSSAAVSRWAFVHGEAWREFYREHFGIAEDRSLVVGSPDLFEHRALPSGDREHGVCYIAQTLVEDGRMERGRYQALLRRITAGLDEDTPLSIKLHPRSDTSLYDELLTRPQTRLLNTLPWTTWYLGHYSTLLLVPAHFGARVIIWRLPGEPIPAVLFEAAWATVDDAQQLRQVVAGNGADTPEGAHAVKAYAADFDEGPFARGARHVLQIMDGEVA